MEGVELLHPSCKSLTLECLWLCLRAPPISLRPPSVLAYPTNTKGGGTDLGLPEHVPPAWGAAGRLALLQDSGTVHRHRALGIAGLTAGHGRILQRPMPEDWRLLAERRPRVRRAFQATTVPRQEMVYCKGNKGCWK